MSSGFLSDPPVIGEIDGADPPEGVSLLIKYFRTRSHDKGPLHIPIRGICRAPPRVRAFDLGHPPWCTLPIRDLPELAILTVYNLPATRIACFSHRAERNAISHLCRCSYPVVPFSFETSLAANRSLPRAPFQIRARPVAHPRPIVRVDARFAALHSDQVLGSGRLVLGPSHKSKRPRPVQGGARSFTDLFPRQRRGAVLS
jgi:hypothetical protein